MFTSYSSSIYICEQKGCPQVGKGSVAHLIKSICMKPEAVVTVIGEF